MFTAVYGEPIIVPCRVQYCKLTEPDTSGEFARGNYNLTMLIPKDDMNTMGTILAACAEVGQVSDYRQLKKHPFLNQRKEFRDGDDPNQNPNGKDKARIGHYFCTVGTDKHFDTFTLVNGDFVECNRGEIYDGCYCAVLCTPAQYREGETTLYLNAVSKVRDGQRLQSRVDSVQAMRNWAGVAGAGGAEQEDIQPEQDAPGPVQPQFGGGGPMIMVQAQSQPQFNLAAQKVETQPQQTQPQFAGPQQPQIKGAVAGEVGTRPKRGRPAGTAKAEGPGPAVPPANGKTSLSDIMAK